MQLVLTQRVCGSPAVDGYTHVKPECLEASPTNQVGEVQGAAVHCSAAWWMVPGLTPCLSPTSG